MGRRPPRSRPAEPPQASSRRIIRYRPIPPARPPAMPLLAGRRSAQPAVGQRDDPAQGGEDRAKPDPRHERVVIGPQHPAALTVRVAERQIKIAEAVGRDRGVGGLAARDRIPAALGVEGHRRAAGPLDDDLRALGVIIGDVRLGHPDKAQGAAGDLQTCRRHARSRSARCAMRSRRRPRRSARRPRNGRSRTPKCRAANGETGARRCPGGSFATPLRSARSVSTPSIAQTASAMPANAAGGASRLKTKTINGASSAPMTRRRKPAQRRFQIAAPPCERPGRSPSRRSPGRGSGQRSRRRIAGRPTA